MSELPFEGAAMRGDPLPDGLCAEDQLMYLSLRNLYLTFYRKSIDRDQASTEKQKLLYEYDKQTRKREFDKKLTAQNVAIHRDIEKFINQYRKDRTIENADKLADAIDGKVMVITE